MEFLFYRHGLVRGTFADAVRIAVVGAVATRHRSLGIRLSIPRYSGEAIAMRHRSLGIILSIPRYSGEARRALGWLVP